MATNYKNNKKKKYGKRPQREDFNKSYSRNDKSKMEDKDKTGSFDRLSSNDIGWWNKASSIYPQVTKIPFNRILGDNMRVLEGQPYYNNDKTAINHYESIPGVLSVDFTPTIGNAETPVDAVNLAFDRLYSYIYQSYTGAANFTKADVAFQVLHEMSIASMIACAKRGLRSLFSYSQINHNFPRLLYSACGFNAANFNYDVEQYAVLVKELNQVILSFNSLYTPRISEVFDRWYSLCNNVWLDDEDVASQMYLFRPTGYYEFIEAHEEGGTLIPSTMSYVGFSGYNQDVPGSGIGAIGDYINYAKILLASIRNTTYFGIVNATLGKVFSGNQLLTVEPYMDGEIISPVYSRNMNWQLNNLYTTDWTLGQYDARSSKLSVTEDVVNNVLVCKPEINSTVLHNLNRRDGWYLNSYDGTTDDEFIMEATRLIPIPRVSGSGITPTTQYAPIVLECGTEIPGKLNIYTMAADVSSSGTDLNQMFQYTFTTSFEIDFASPTLSVISDGLSTINLYYFLKIVSKLSKFRNAPRLYIDGSGADYKISEIGDLVTPLDLRYHVPFVDIGDVYKFTLINSDGIKGLHDAAKLSVFTGIVENL